MILTDLNKNSKGLGDGDPMAIWTDWMKSLQVTDMWEEIQAANQAAKDQGYTVHEDIWEKYNPANIGKTTGAGDWFSQNKGLVYGAAGVLGVLVLLRATGGRRR